MAIKLYYQETTLVELNFRRIHCIGQTMRSVRKIDQSMGENCYGTADSEADFAVILSEAPTLK